jgi:carboxyl-terminal processing protease
MGRTFRGFALLPLLITLAACGSGGGGYGGNPTAPPPPSGTSVPYTAGVFQPRGSLINQCTSSAAQNNFLRSWSNELYLWYRELPDVNPNSTTDIEDYFNQLKTSALTTSGQPKDRFHFTYDTDDWIALSQSGVEAGYGAEWFLASTTPPRRILVAYTDPNSPAAAAGVMRGFEVLTVDGADAINGNTQAVVDALNAGVFPSSAGQSHTFTMRDPSGATRTITMTSANVTSTPVPTVSTINTPSGLVGYLVFHDHIATSEAALISAINTLRSQNIVDLILDIRYNGGGYLDIASELAYMIGGGLTVGQTFERLTFNDKHPNTNPVTGQALAPTPFHTSGRFGASAGATLPTLNLPQPRVYVLTGRNTCSASEAIINGLRGVDVEVYQIGSTTCGKPYGFYSQDNCGTTYFSIQFQGDNAKGFGAYSDGFSPNNTSGVAGERLPGCSVADDFSRALGNQSEARLAAALAFRASGNQASACPAATGFAPGVFTKFGQPLAIVDGVMIKSPARENRILRDMM